MSSSSLSSSFADDTKIWRGVTSIGDCDTLQIDLQAVYDWPPDVNMHFDSCKFEWIRYATNPSAAPPYQYSVPDASAIYQSENLRDLGVRVSSV